MRFRSGNSSRAARSGENDRRNAGLHRSVRNQKFLTNLIFLPYSSQVRDGSYDRNADIYSLGGVLFHMLSGTEPPKSGSLNVPRHVSESGRRLIERMMEPQPELRIPLDRKPLYYEVSHTSKHSSKCILTATEYNTSKVVTLFFETKKRKIGKISRLERKQSTQNFGKNVLSFMEILYPLMGGDYLQPFEKKNVQVRRYT